jgi:hypothetical protein
MTMSILAAGWRFGADDPTILGWVTTASYFLAAFLCVRAAFIVRNNFGAFGLATQPWWLLAGILIALGTNKELDLQTLLIDIARGLATTEGWYNHRRIVQEAFVMVVVIAGALVAWRFVRRYRHFISKHPATMAGLALVLLYCLLRVADIDHLEGFGSNQFTSEFLWPLEMSGLILLLLGSARMAVTPLPQ